MARGGPRVGQKASKWILKVDKVSKIDELEDSENFSSLDAKLATALSRIAQGDLSHRINFLKEQKFINENLCPLNCVA